MTMTGELKRKIYDEYLSLHDGDKDKALTDLGTFYLGWLAIEKGLTQQAVDVGAIRQVIAWLRRQEGTRCDPDHIADKLTAALPKDSNGAEGV
jgi:hypothetical protein